MGILLGLIGAIGVVLGLLWRLQSAANAARSTIEVADEARGLFRRLAWNRKASRNQLDMVDDPREAAAAMMIAVAQYDGAMTASEQTAISNEVSTIFQASAREAEELLQRGRWLMKDMSNIDASLKRLSRPIDATLNRDEKEQLIGMLMRVASADQTASAALTHSIVELERRLLPKLH